MVGIDRILELLSETNTQQEQNIGLKYARKVKTVSVFVQPLSTTIGMKSWENCARVLAEKEDAELQPILYRLFCWLSDSTFPGAITIARRLFVYERNDYFMTALRTAQRVAKERNEKEWLYDIEQFVIQGDFSEFDELTDPQLISSNADDQKRTE